MLRGQVEGYISRVEMAILWGPHAAGGDHHHQVAASSDPHADCTPRIRAKDGFYLDPKVDIDHRQLGHLMRCYRTVVPVHAVQVGAGGVGGGDVCFFLLLSLQPVVLVPCSKPRRSPPRFLRPHRSHGTTKNSAERGLTTSRSWTPPGGRPACWFTSTQRYRE